YGVLNGRTERYFMIRIVSSGLRVMVPQSNATAVGLRSVIRSAESSKVLGFLETGKLNSHHDWKHRFKENSERMRTGSLLEVAVVLKSLVSLSRSKPLSFREKKMLERAKYLLVSEMATARNLTSETAEPLAAQSLATAKLQFPVMHPALESVTGLSVCRGAGTNENRGGAAVVGGREGAMGKVADDGILKFTGEAERLRRAEREDLFKFAFAASDCGFPGLNFGRVFGM